VPLNLDRDPDTEDFTEGEVTLSPTGAGPVVEEELGGVLHRLYRVVCDDGQSSDRWVRIGITVADLLPGVVDRASAVLQLPVPDINPEPADGGIVNVGLWLAVEPQTVTPLSAEAGPGVWIVMSPQLSATRFAFGNGDAIECDGTGVPIREVYPDLEVLEESPWCGYTYRSSSPEDDPYLLSVTTVWELPYTSSAGGGSAPPLERTLSVAYDVDEIQTVGVSN